MQVGLQTHRLLARQQQLLGGLLVLLPLRARAPPREAGSQDCSRTLQVPCPSPSHRPAGKPTFMPLQRQPLPIAITP